MRRTAAGGFDIVGQPEGIERLGGIDLDQLMLEHVLDAAGAGAALDGEPDEATLAALVELRDRCQTAKETLSIDADVRVAVNLPGLSTAVRVTRDELDSMARPRIMETVEATQRAIRSSGLSTSDVDRVLLVGGSSRIPLVADTVRATLRCPVALDANPKTAICEGAALLDATRSPARGFAAPPTPAGAGAAPPPPRLVAAPVPAPPASGPVAALTAQQPGTAPPAGFEAPPTIRVVSPPTRSRPKWLIPVAAVATVAAIAGTAAVVLGSDGGDGARQDPSTSVELDASATSEPATTTVTVVAPPTSAAATATDPAATTIAARVAETTAPTTFAATTATTIGPVTETTTAPAPPPSADEQLTALVDADRAFVTDNMLGRFVVQVNAKFLNRVDDLDGQFYDAQRILDTYSLMEQLHGPVVMIRQDEFNHSEVHPDLFQILMREVFPSRATPARRAATRPG